MSRPRPLVNLSSARPGPTDYQALTPRTPHSRAGRAEEGFTEVELDDLNESDDDYRTARQQQAVPLLSSSASDSFPTTGYRSGGDDYDAKEGGKRTSLIQLVLSRIPLLAGCAMAGILFILIVLSVKKPEALQKIIGSSAAQNASASAITGNDESTKTTPALSPKPTVQGGMAMPSDSKFLSYENYTQFPLRGMEYRDECSKMNQGYMSHGDYWEPHKMGTLDVPHHDDNTDYHLPEGMMTTVCKSTVTYQLDGQAGLLADLSLMAQVAALACERNRTFLVDDTYWNRGRWLDHFQDVRSRQPGPEPGCRAPPPEELVACPRLARHWVVNSRTAKFHLGHGFSDHYEDAYGHDLNRLEPMFNFARTSLEETIRPNGENAELIRSARLELLNFIAAKSPATDIAKSDPAADSLSPYIAVHVRRGDRKASYAWPNRRVPMSEFVDAVGDTWERLITNDTFTIGDNIPLDPVVFFSSDDPYALAEFQELLPDITPFTLAKSQNPHLQALASPGEYFQKDFGGLEEEVRVKATRGMIVDFALMSGMWAWENEVIPDATICTISSNACKLSAIGLGWERAFGGVNQMGAPDKDRMRWIEVDQKGGIIPIWEAFELFT